ncbi:hypothetical protein [Maridesulfovibrio ferrireducens]|uniref:hypothetical protein n=1 Tax=Maridesulfovibrio ferrireducens TaxID=246191 RepID=UPI001A1CA048|nr:hypothetical protein [Maridesulfovibrio ferrireducens]MBI9113256.1 hypothetical protein [Maridesulfovibrio ferrireducens]
MSPEITSAKELPSKSWEIFTYARNLLSITGLYRIFHVEKVQIYRYSKDPAIYEDASRNPIDQVSHMLREVAEAGEVEGRTVAKITLNLMAKDIGLKVVDIKNGVPVHESLHAEFLEIYTALSALQQAAHRQEHPLVIVEYLGDVKKGLVSFLAHYEKEYIEKDGIIRFSIGSAPKPSFWRKLWPFGR